MSIRRKELPLPHREDEQVKLELLASFPHPPIPRLLAPLQSQQPGINLDVWKDGSTGHSVYNDIDSDSLYEDPGPPLSSPYSRRDTPPVHVHPVSSPQPHPEFQIVFDHPSRLYAPGDTISGYIIGHSTAEDEIQVIFTGYATTSLRDSGTIHTDHTSLVHQVKNVLPGSETIPRFEIKIPFACKIATSGLDDLTPRDDLKIRWTDTWPPEDTFENEDGHPLPPSMHMVPRKLSTLSGVFGEASIVYSVIAVRSALDTKSNKLIPNATCRLPLTVTTLRFPALRMYHLARETCTLSCNLSAQTAALSKERKLRLREQLRDAFNTSAPTFHFKAKVTVSKIGAPGADMKARVDFEVLPPPAGHLYNFPLPDIAINSMTFRIRSYTGIRVLVPSAQSQSTVESPPTASRKETFKHTEFHQTQTPNDVVFKPRDGGYEGQVCVATIPLPGDLTPSFKTYNAWQGYRLEYVIRIQVAGKQVEAKVASDLNIVAGEDATKA